MKSAGAMMAEVSPEELDAIQGGKRVLQRILQVDAKGDGRTRAVREGDRIRLWAYNGNGHTTYAYEASYKVTKTESFRSPVSETVRVARTWLRKLPRRK